MTDKIETPTLELIDDLGPRARTKSTAPSIIYEEEISRYIQALLGEESVLNIDATFKALPNVPNARQCLTIMAPITGVALPIVYVVMKHKTMNCYIDVFEEVLRLVPGMRPRAVIVDFEAGLQRAVQHVFGNNILIVGCWFHCSQAILRLERYLRLTRAVLGANSRLLDIIDMAKALPLLPADYIPAGIEYLIEYSNGAQEIRPFLEYLRWQWELMPFGPGVKNRGGLVSRCLPGAVINYLMKCQFQ